MNNYTDEDIRKLYKRNFGNVDKVKEITGYSEKQLNEILGRVNIGNIQNSKRGKIAQLLQEGRSIQEVMEIMSVSIGYVKNIHNEMRLEESLKEQEQKIRVRIAKRKEPVAYPVIINGHRYLDVTEEFMEQISLEYRNLVMNENLCV